MSSELSGSRGDRPEPGGDRPREHRPWDDPGRDVTPVPASAGWKPEGKFSRADYYDDDGTPKDRDPGAARDAHRADSGDQGDAPQPDGPADDPAEAGSESRDVEDETVPGSEDSGLRVQETPEETAEAAAAGGSDPPRRPPGGDSPQDERPPGPGHDRVPPPGPRDQDPGEEDADRKPAPVRPEQRETPRGDAAAGQDTGTRAGDDDGQERQSGDQPAEQGPQEEKPRDQVRVQHPPTDANVDQGNEAAPDSAADQRPDDPRMATMEQQMERMLSIVETMQAKLDESEARHDELSREIGNLKTENRELKEEVAELKAEDSTDQHQQEGAPDRGERPEPDDIPDVTEQERLGIQGTDDSAANDTEQADAEAFNDRWSGESAKAGHKASPKPDRGVFSDEGISALQTAAGLAGFAGLEPRVVAAAFAADSAKRAVKKLPPDEQRSAIHVASDAGNLYGTMSPGAATATLAVTVAVPVIHTRFRTLADKLRRKD